MKPLSQELENYILSENARLRIRAVGCKVAPPLSSSFQGDRGEWNIYVWSGASSRTIWSSPAVNVAFRAWHDYGHLTTGLGLDPTSETELAWRMELATKEAGLSEDARKVLFAETAGQIVHFEKHGGAFPENQRAFVKAYAAGKWAGERF